MLASTFDLACSAFLPFSAKHPLAPALAHAHAAIHTGANKQKQRDTLKKGTEAHTQLQQTLLRAAYERFDPLPLPVCVKAHVVCRINSGEPEENLTR